MRTIVIAGLVLSASALSAQASDFTEGLAWVVAADRTCGLTYKPEALQAMIEANVAADDLDFARDLNHHVYLDNLALDRMTDATKAALCVQVERAARAHGLID